MDPLPADLEEALIWALENSSPSSILRSEASSVIFTVTNSHNDTATIIMLRGIFWSGFS